MIPKTIHYCWFGDKPLPPLVEDCIASWKEKMPGYDIVEWNERNIPTDIWYVNTALKHKQYANASDFIRMYVTYHHGGVYLDTDVEIIQSLDFLRDTECFLGFHSPYCLNNAVFGCVKGNKIPKKCMESILSLYNGCETAYFSGPYTLTKIITNLHTLNYQSEIMRFPEFSILPIESCDPKSTFAKIAPKEMHTDKRILCIHHEMGSWKDKSMKTKIRRRLSMYLERKLPPIYKLAIRAHIFLGTNKYTWRALDCIT